MAFLRRHGVEALTALYVLLVVYNSLLPLDFSRAARQTERAAGWALGLPVVAASLPDAVSNVAFYVPLGVLLGAALIKAGWNRWLAIIPTVLCAAGVSYLMEWAQLWSTVRISSSVDWLCNLAGAAAGAAASGPIVLVTGDAARKIGRELRDRPALVFTSVLGFTLVMAALVPLDVTFSADRLRHAVKSASVVPFEKLQHTSALSAVGRGNHAPQIYHAHLRDWWMLVLDYATWSVLYATLAIATCYYLRTHCRMSAPAAALHAMGMCVVYALGSSALQLFIISRGLDVTVPMFQVGGALLGALLHPAALTHGHGAGTPFSPLSPARVRQLVAIGLAVATMGIVLRETAPFRIDASAEGTAAQMRVIDWLPLAAYGSVRLPVAVDDIVRKVLRFATLGALVAAAGAWRAVPVGARGPWRIAARVALAIGALEVLQILLPSRVPGVTDVLLALFGTAAGVYLCQTGRRWWQETRPIPLQRAQLGIDYRVELGDPSDDSAPREQVPTAGKRER